MLHGRVQKPHTFLGYADKVNPVQTVLAGKGPRNGMRTPLFQGASYHPDEPAPRMGGRWISEAYTPA